MKYYDLKSFKINSKYIYRNPSAAFLYEQSIKYEKNTALSESGALIVYSNEKTGRSPKDKHIENDFIDQKNIWWEPVNKKINTETFEINKKIAINFFNTKEILYVIDGFAGWDKNFQLKIRVICTRAYHALFMQNMLIQPTKEELKTLNFPDYTIFNAGECSANSENNTISYKTSVDISFEKKEFIILGTEYAGEMKKGVFTIINYLMPKKNILSMHCSATEGLNKDVTLLFGLSGTGKTTLSADPNRVLIGDDEHCWSDNGIFNIEGGCYAKVLNLSEKKEPQIFNAIKYNTILENVIYDKTTRKVDYSDGSITKNTRASYPIKLITNNKIPCIGNHPKNIIFLTCDAFGVLPAVSKLTTEQISYHFILGYTAKVSGTEVGITEPKATFSACFGAAFMIWPPIKYATLLAKKVKKYNVQGWLINTGWRGGSYHTGKRFELKYTRAIIDSIHSESLNQTEFERDKFFGLYFPKRCENVPSELLNPKNSWQNKQNYDDTAKKLACLFKNKFKDYASYCENWIIKGGPII